MMNSQGKRKEILVLLRVRFFEKGPFSLAESNRREFVC